MRPKTITIRNIDDWYEKWRVDSKLVNYEDANTAIDELEALVEGYCDLDLKNRKKLG